MSKPSFPKKPERRFKEPRPRNRFDPIGTRNENGLHWPLIALSFGLLLATGCASKPDGGKSLTPIPGQSAAHGMMTMPAHGHSAATDELWVISRSISNSGPPSRNNDVPQPGTGVMIRADESGDAIVPLPLEHTDVKAEVTGFISSVQVRQRFHNPFSGKIEAKYVFPLPQDAAVNEFLMIIGDRRIRGLIREREEAEAIYQQAKSQGRIASLLTQERPNIFTQSVANIDPGRSIDVSITYFNTLAYRDGWYEFAFPMVIGPRFHPPGATNGIGAVSHHPQRASGFQPAVTRATTATHLNSDERSGHDIALTLNVDAGVVIEAFECPSHVIEASQTADDQLHVTLGRLDRIPNKDFVLRFRVAGDRMKSNLLTHRDERGGFFTLMVHPPMELNSLKQHPLEMVFVLDCSGSMSGGPIAQARAAVRRALTQLRPEDSFQLINFANDSSRLGDRPLSATPANVKRGLAYLDTLESEGGTMMIKGINAALNFPHDPERLRFVVFLTDGHIGNEAEIFTAVHRRLGASRIFSFGVGSAPNGHLLDGLARIGNGAVASLGLNDDAAQVMDRFMHRVRHPALLDVSIDWGGWQVSDVFPRRLPDVFVGRPLILTGRFEGSPTPPIRIRGTAGSRPVVIDVDASPDAAGTNRSALANIWARKQIMALSDRQSAVDDPTLATRIKQLALDHQLMSAYTAFITVDSLSRTGGGPSTTVPQAVPVPEALKDHTTVGR